MIFRCMRARFAMLAILFLLVSGARVQGQSIKVGVVPGPYAQVMEFVKEVAAKDGLNIEVVAFSNPSQLNAAVHKGALDANSFQDLPSLQSEIKAHGYDLAEVGTTITLPLGFYSKKIRSLRELKPGDTVAIPNDPYTAARALILLHNYGLIAFRDDAGDYPKLADIVANPRELKIVEVDTDHVPQSLKTSTLAAFTFSTAAELGLYPARDAIGMEDARCPYAGILVTRTDNRAKPWVTKLISAYHSAPVKQFILIHFNDSVRRPW